jgi:hypothetical protein
MLKLILLLTLAPCFAQVATADSIHLNREGTLHAIAKDDDLSEVTCQYCDRADSSSDACTWSESREGVRFLMNFKVDPLDTSEAKKYDDESLVSITDQSKAWQKLFESTAPEKREQVLKKKMCEGENPQLTQIFTLTYPEANEGEAVDEYAKARQMMVKMVKGSLNMFYSFQIVKPKGNLSCLKDNLETVLPVVVKDSVFQSQINYEKPKLDPFYVRLGDSTDLKVGIGLLKVMTKSYHAVNSENFSNYNEDFRVSPDFPYLFQDKGESSEKRRKLEIRKQWEIDTLSKHFVFMSAGRKISESIKAANLDWRRYLIQNASVKSEDGPLAKSVKFTLSVDLKGFCKGAEPLYDLTTH